MTILIITHLIVFESMFIFKNILLKKRLGISVRGKNREAIIAILLFAITISLVLFSMIYYELHTLLIVSSLFTQPYFIVIGILLLLTNLFFAALSLFQMGNSWRVGIKEGDVTELVTKGICSYSRNPYFLSYILLFIAYSLLIPNILVIVFSFLSVISIHIMILREEKHLLKTFGERYFSFKNTVPRYLLF